MKKLLSKILLVLSIISFFGISNIWNVYADTITVKVTEKIPGAGCTGDTPPYTCEIEEGFWSIMSMFWKIIKYFTYIAALWWVLFIIINGIMYSMWWAEPSFKDDAKKRITWTLIWLILLFLSWVILNLIAPWIYKG
jgi:hypothetical protein